MPREPCSDKNLLRSSKHHATWVSRLIGLHGSYWFRDLPALQQDHGLETTHCSAVRSILCLNGGSALPPGALARAEWIKFLGTFFNLDAEANAYFNGVVQNYNAIKVPLYTPLQGRQNLGPSPMP